MRVVSGKYKGRVLKGYNQKTTRPTTDKVKESIFSMIRPYLENSVCLDLFAGTGSLGIEALSNHCDICYFVDQSKVMTNIIDKHIKNIDPNMDANIITSSYNKALLKFQEDNIKFDIVFLDPPYDKFYINDCLNKLIEYNLLNDNALIVCEYDKEVFNHESYNVLKEKKYGNIFVKILEKKQ